MHFKSSNPEPPHLTLICKGDRREVLIKVIKRTNLIKSGAGFLLEGGVEVLVCVCVRACRCVHVCVCAEKNLWLHLYSETLRKGVISCLIN